jgi:hypothetical protein
MERDHGGPHEESPEDEGIPDIGRPHPGKRDTGDPQEGLVLPRDEPTAVDDYGTTAAEQRDGEPLDERLRQEERDRERAVRPTAGRLVEEGSGLVDVEKDEVADQAPDDADGASAEEAAVRIVDDPPGGTDHPDSYVEEGDEGR